MVNNNPSNNSNHLDKYFLLGNVDSRSEDMKFTKEIEESEWTVKCPVCESKMRLVDDILYCDVCKYKSVREEY